MKSEKTTRGPSTGLTLGTVRASVVDSLESSSHESFASYDPVTSSWKTSQLCLLAEREAFSESWPRAGVMRGGTAYRRPPLAPLTKDTCPSLLRCWPTPTTNHQELSREAALRAKRRGQQVSLSGAVNIHGDESGRLNPLWVEALMGFPLGWTDTTGS